MVSTNEMPKCDYWHLLHHTYRARVFPPPPDTLGRQVFEIQIPVSCTLVPVWGRFFWQILNFRETLLQRDAECMCVCVGQRAPLFDGQMKRRPTFVGQMKRLHGKQTRHTRHMQCSTRLPAVRWCLDLRFRYLNYLCVLEDGCISRQ